MDATRIAPRRFSLNVADVGVFNTSGAKRDVSMAKSLASDAAMLAARNALQVHGAIGYTEEHDLHLWLKAAWALSLTYGDAAHHRERVFSVIS